MMQDLSPMTNQIDGPKVIVLGDSEAGKSLLISRILNHCEIPETANSWDTAGISIQNHVFEVGGQAIRVNFWGFSGLAIRNSMHQVFMTQRAIYVIVVNVRDDSQEDRARFWLNTVEMAAPGAPVLLVLNKMDLNPNASINESDLRSKYPNLCEVVRVSAAEDATDRFHTNFESVLLRLIHDRASRLFPQPERWHLLKEELSKRDFRHIDISEFHDLCDRYWIDPDEEVRMELLQWLSDSGVVFLLPDSSMGRIYQTGWIIDALIRVTHIPVRLEHNGIVSHEELNRLLGSADTDSTYADAFNLLHVMRCFRLSMRINDSLEFLPMLCDRNTKPIAWEYREDDTALEFRVDFDHLPTSVIHQLMVRYQAELDTENIWYSGAHLIFAGRGASALLQSEGNSVVMYVRCGEEDEPMRYVGSMLGALQHTILEYGLRITDRKVAYKQGGLRDVFPYDMLEGSLRSGVTHVYSRTFERMLSIEEILHPAQKQQIVSEKLLLDIAQACESVQRFFGTANRTEDHLNAVLRNALWQMGHVIADHRLLDLPSKTGKRAGEVDILLIDENRKPLTMIEAVRLQTMGRTGMRYWEEHLSRLLLQYSGSDLDLPVMFMISYAECSKDKYEPRWKYFSEHVRWYDPERMKRREGSCSEVRLKEQTNPYLRIAKCDYDFRGRTITVYQYFVWVEPGSENGTGPVRTDPFRDDVVDLPQKNNNVPKPAPNPSLPQAAPVPEESRKYPEPPADQAAEEKKLPRKEYRVVFLGDSEAGKSQLLARVMDPEKGLEKFDGMTTPGISLEHQIHNFDGTWVRVNFWDFGGQEILHSLHRMFLSVDTLYVIVLNTRNDNHDAQADFWMRYVQSYAYGAPVLFVLNKIDQNPKAKLNLPVLNRRFSKKFTKEDVLRICAIDKDHEKFQREFTKKLLDRVKAEVEGSDEFSGQTAVIRAAVEEKKKTDCVIKESDFRNICSKAGLTVSGERVALMKRFHQAGILVFFGTEFKMLLDPQWITKAIYAVLEKQDELTVNGIVSREKLQDLYYDMLGDSEYAGFVLDVMRFYGLSFLYKARNSEDDDSENLEFIPMLCHQEEPEKIHDMTMADNTVVLEMHFEYLPTGVLYQLMVKFSEHLDKNFVWRSGARFQFGSLVSAIVRRDANVMQIYVHYDTVGAKNRALEYMKKFMDETSIIAERGKATAKLLDVKLGYMVGTIMEFFDYKQLMNAQKSRVYYVASTVKERCKIFVDDILKQEDGRESQTIRKLLELCLDCSEEMQGTQTYWFRHKEAAADKSAPKMGEDQRTHLFKVMLKDSFTVSEQPRWGASASGVSSGELDLQINAKDGDMLAILEALNITGDNQTSRDNWKEHLSRMMNHYNQNGLRHLLLISYLDCDKEKVGAVQDAYLELLRTYEVPKYGAPEEIITDLLPNCPNEIQVVQADYYTATGVVSVYHYLIHLSRYIGQNENDKKPSDTKDDQKTT